MKNIKLPPILDEGIFIYKLSWTDFAVSTPEVYLLLMFCTALIWVGIAHFAPSVKSIEQKKKTTLSLYEFTRVTLLLTLIQYLVMLSFVPRLNCLIFYGYFTTDFYVQVLKAAVVVAVIVILTASKRYIVEHPRHLMEFPVLIMATTLFLLLFCSAFNLISLFLCMVAYSTTLYVLLFFDSSNESSREAGSKYFVISTVSSGCIIGGILIAYFIFHTTSFLSLNWNLRIWRETNVLLEFWKTGPWETPNLLLCIMVYLIVLGFLFKLAAFPCHLWAPEIYDGSPHPITAFFVVPVKIATLGVLLRLLNYTFMDMFFMWDFIIWMSGFFSMVWGGLSSLRERNFKRFVAYSSINHMGFLMTGLASGTMQGLQSTLIYLLLYILMNLAFFIFFLNTTEEKTNRSLTYLTDFNDYGRDNYLYTSNLIIIFFSMAGIPPLGGFLSKYLVMLQAYEEGHILMVAVGMVTSVLAVYYYFRIIKYMWFEKPIKNRFKFYTSFTAPLSFVYFFTVFLLISFILWTPWLFPWMDLLATSCYHPVFFF